jgi:single-strand DNA-binding protein
MSSVNSVAILGNVGQDPEIKNTAGGTVAKLSIATTRRTKAKTTDWHRVTVFGKAAEIVEQYVKKGDRIHIQGRIEYSTSGEGADKKYYTDIIAHEVTLLGGRQAEPAPVADPFADSDDLPFK